MSKCVVLVGLLAFVLVGCGDDVTQNQQTQELQMKFLDQQAQIKELQMKLMDQQAQLKQLEGKLSGVESAHGGLTQQVALMRKTSTDATLTKAEIPSTPPRGETVRSTAEELRAHSQRRMILRNEQMVVERGKRAIQAMLSQGSLDDLVTRLNSSHILHPDGEAWTRPRVEAFMLEHNIERQAQK